MSKPVLQTKPNTTQLGHEISLDRRNARRGISVAGFEILSEPVNLVLHAICEYLLRYLILSHHHSPYAYSGPPYNFSAIEVGPCYISNCLGYAIGIFVGGRLSDHKSRQYQATHDGKTDPFARLCIVWYGASCVPIAWTLYGWLMEAKYYWLVPLVGMFLFSLGLMLVRPLRPIWYMLCPAQEHLLWLT